MPCLGDYGCVALLWAHVGLMGSPRQSPGHGRLPSVALLKVGLTSCVALGSSLPFSVPHFLSCEIEMIAIYPSVRVL